MTKHSLLLVFLMGSWIGGCSTTNAVNPKILPAPDASVFAQVPASTKTPQVAPRAPIRPLSASQPVTAPLPHFDPESTIFFPPQSVALTPETMQILHRLADRLKANRLSSVLLIGHTDDVGGNEYCIARASKLTSAVSAALEKLDVRPTQIRELPKGSVGSQYPGCTSDDCRRSLRRVELQVSGS